MAQDELTGLPNELEEQASALMAWAKEFNLNKGLPLDDLAVIFSRLSFNPDAVYPIFGESKPVSECKENICPAEATVKEPAGDFTINHKEDEGRHVCGLDELVKLRDIFLASIPNLSAVEELGDLIKLCKQLERDPADHGIIVPPIEAAPSESTSSH